MNEIGILRYGTVLDQFFQPGAKNVEKKSRLIEIGRTIKTSQIPDPDTSGVPRRRFALGCSVGLPTRFEVVVEGAFDIPHWL